LAIKLGEKATKLIEGKELRLSILLPNGLPRVTPIWIDQDGDLILMNTAVGRIKQKQTTKGKRVSVAIADQNNVYEHVTIQGLVDHTKERADARIDKLANKYTGAKKYELSSPTEQRVIKVEPLRIY